MAWIIPVVDRKLEDVLLKTKKGYCNASDLNRIEGNCAELASLFGVDIQTKSWSMDDFPFASQMQRILSNIDYLREIYYTLSSTTTTVTLPAGRMKGDVNGDGIWSQADIDLISDHTQNSPAITDPVALWCAEISGDDRITVSDTIKVRRLISGQDKIGKGGNDYTGNWIANPNYATEVGQFYHDFTVAGVTASNSATLIAPFNNVADVVCHDGYVRVFVSLVPITDIEGTLIILPTGGKGRAAIETPKPPFNTWQKFNDAEKILLDLHELYLENQRNIRQE